MGTWIAFTTKLHPKHQMTCMLKEYPLLVDPPHGAISGRMQWDSMHTLTVAPSEDVEMRWCADEPPSNEATATTRVELYIRVD